MVYSECHRGVGNPDDNQEGQSPPLLEFGDVQRTPMLAESLRQLQSLPEIIEVLSLVGRKDTAQSTTQPSAQPTSDPYQLHELLSARHHRYTPSTFPARESLPYCDQAEGHTDTKKYSGWNALTSDQSTFDSHVVQTRASLFLPKHDNTVVHPEKSSHIGVVVGFFKGPWNGLGCEPTGIALIPATQLSREDQRRSEALSGSLSHYPWIISPAIIATYRHPQNFHWRYIYDLDRAMARSQPQVSAFLVRPADIGPRARKFLEKEQHGAQ